MLSKNSILLQIVSFEHYKRTSHTNSHLLITDWILFKAFRDFCREVLFKKYFFLYPVQDQKSKKVISHDFRKKLFHLYECILLRLKTKLNTFYVLYEDTANLFTNFLFFCSSDMEIDFWSIVKYIEVFIIHTQTIVHTY